MHIWHEDADSFTGDDDFSNIVLRNKIVETYLSDTRILGIAAIKGQGKTFLIKAKRKKLQNTKEGKDESTSVTCYPKGSLVDTLISPINFNHKIKGLLKEYETWVSLWQFSIAAAIINSDEFSILYNDSDFQSFSEVANFHFNRTKIGKVENTKNIYDQKAKPSVIFNRLLHLDVSELRQILKDTTSAMQLLGKVSNGVYFFIDKVDQAFAGNIYKIKSEGNDDLAPNASYWQYCQYALANAAYNLLSVNPHIKIFYTIRSEAIVGSSKLAKNTDRNIKDLLIELSYSKDDMHDMFDLYVKHEKDENLYDSNLKNSNAEKALFGFEKVPHALVKDKQKNHIEETSFDYLYRHSLLRPCDLMSLCKKIYLSDLRKLNVERFKNIINKKSVEILEQYLSEVEPFIDMTQQELNQLLNKINTNIFSYEYEGHVCERYNTELGNISGCNKDCISCNNIHPFSILYNIGILGYLRDDGLKTHQQCFSSIGNIEVDLNERPYIRNSDLFFLHPALCDKTRKARNCINKEFITNVLTIVGEEITIEEDKIRLTEKCLPKLMEQLNDDKIFISSTIEDLGNERRAVKDVLIKKHLYPIMSEELDFECGNTNIHSHDHCINEMLKCKQIIYIIGNSYGGIYTGNEYTDYAKEIKAKSNGMIEEPSISLMEFYIAKIKKLEYKIFVLENVLDEKRANTPNKCDEKVFKIINYINHLSDENEERRGNWFTKFKNANELSKAIRCQKFHINRSRNNILLSEENVNDFL
jgi:hypothetical protein